MIDYREDAIWKVYVHIIPKEISGYKHDKYYVGITRKDFVEQRWGKDGYNYKYNKHFYNAVQKYGWNNIVHEIIAENLTKNEACDMEMILIKKLNSFNPRYGYNKTLGGDGLHGYHMSDKERKIRSEKYKGDNNPYFGKKHSLQVRKTMSEHHCDFFGSNNPKAKKIYQFDLWGNYIAEYPTGKDASIAMGTSDGMINAAIHRNSFHGYLWAQEDNVEIKNGIINMKEVPELNKGTHGIYQFDLDGNFIRKYRGYKEAAECNLGTTVNGITRAAKGIIPYYKNYIWKYYNEVRRSDDNSENFYIVNK